MFFKKKSTSVEQFEALLSPHLDSLYRFAYRLTNSRDDAEDLVQDLVEKIFYKNQDLSQVEELRSWLSKVLYRIYVDQYRRRVRSPVQFIEDPEALYEDVDNEDPESRQSKDQLAAGLQIALDQLNENQRILIMMHDVEGYSVDEISKIMNIPHGTIKSRLHRGRLALKKSLGEGNLQSVSCV